MLTWSFLKVGNEFSSVEALWSQFESVMEKQETLQDRLSNADEESNEDDTTIQLPGIRR